MFLVSRWTCKSLWFSNRTSEPLCYHLRQSGIWWILKRAAIGSVEKSSAISGPWWGNMDLADVRFIFSSRTWTWSFIRFIFSSRTWTCSFNELTWTETLETEISLLLMVLIRLKIAMESQQSTISVTMTKTTAKMRYFWNFPLDPKLEAKAPASDAAGFPAGSLKKYLWKWTIKW